MMMITQGATPTKTSGCIIVYSLLLLLISSHEVDAFTRIVPTAPKIVARSVEKQQPLSSLGRSNSSSHPLVLRSSRAKQDNPPSSKSGNKKGDDKNNWLARAVSACLILLWRGITLPFPMLRDADQFKSGSSFFSLRECLLAIGAYLALGAVAYTRIFERWSLVDALYFSVVSFSTVGYGDVCPTNIASKIFTCFFGLGGVAFLGVAIATIGTSLIEAELDAAQKAESAGRKRLLSFFEGMPSALTRFKSGKGVVPEKEAATSDESVVENMVDNTVPEATWFWTKSINKVVPKFIPSVTLLVVGGTIMGRVEGWSWLNSMYYSVVTAGTLGFGDVVPVSRNGRLWAICFIPIAVAAAGEFLGNIANLLVERRQVARSELLMNRELDMTYLKEIDGDGNGNGEVDRLEYVSFMLKAMGVVEQDVLDELLDQFDRLDEDNSGKLDKDDLRLMAELRGLRA